MDKKVPAKKRRTTKKRTTASRKSSSAKMKKSKVYIPAYKIIILCISIIILCMILLLATTVKSSDVKSSLKNTIAQRFEKVEKVDEKEEDVREEKAAVKKDVTKKSDAVAKKSDEVSTGSTNGGGKAKKADVSEGKSAKKSSDVSKKSDEVAKKSSEVSTGSTNGGGGGEKANSPKTDNGEKIKKDVAKKSNEVSTGSTNGTAYNFPKAQKSAQLIFVFDDAGQNNAQLEKFVTLPFPITVAVLPQLGSSVAAANRIRQSGNEIILHQPMQSVNSKVNPGPGAITPEMTEAEIIAQLFINLQEIGPVAGMNNHEGSAITADAEKMAIILQTASENGIYFLDSRTNKDTKVPYVAGELGYKYYERNVFLDNEKTEAFALKELRRGLDIANKNGNVIMIGHIWSADFLPAFLKKVYPELKAAGYTFCTVGNSNAQK